MAKAIALTSAHMARTQLAHPAEILRAAIVCVCGVALVMAGPVLPL
ncbi:hypothetical protein ACRAQ7_04475 [Erythrobacter sp. W53]